MIKKIDILGMSIDNYTTRENIIRVEKFFETHEFNTVQEIGMETLKNAEIDHHVKELISSLDCTIISDVGILKAAKIESIQKLHEVEDGDFFYQFMSRMDRNRRKIYILGPDEEVLSTVSGFIHQNYTHLHVLGEKIMLDVEESIETIVNEINSASAEVILSVLPSPQGELFLAKAKGMLSAEIWYGADQSHFTEPRKNFKTKLMDAINVKRLTERISDYRDQGKDS